MLLDFASWAQANGKDFRAFEKYAITLDDVKAIAEAQKVSFATGDVLFLRTGYLQSYRDLNIEGRTDVASKREWMGLGQGKDTTEWLWGKQFSAVASDSPGFECRRKLHKNHHGLKLTSPSAGRSCMASTSNSACWLGHTNRRALRSRSSCGIMRQKQAMDLFLHQRSTQFRRRRGFAAKRNCHTVASGAMEMTKCWPEV